MGTELKTYLNFFGYILSSKKERLMILLGLVCFNDELT